MLSTKLSRIKITNIEINRIIILAYRSSEPTASRDVYEVSTQELESKAVENAKIMVHFAVMLQERLKKFNTDTCQSFELRIGMLKLETISVLQESFQLF